MAFAVFAPPIGAELLTNAITEVYNDAYYPSIHPCMHMSSRQCGHIIMRCKYTIIIPRNIMTTDNAVHNRRYACATGDDEPG
jgi:hypothetical protein